MWGLTIMASRQVGVLALFHARAEIVRIGKRVDSQTPYCYPVNVDIRHSDIESKKPSGSTGEDGNG